MKDVIRTRFDYAEASKVLKETLDLDGSPVAFKFCKTAEEIPEGMTLLTEKIRHCQMVGMARKEGKIFYSTVDNHSCMGGSWALGLRELTPTLKSGEFYYKLGKFESWAACKRTIDRVPHVESLTTHATLYAPLEKTPFDPTLVLIITKPKAMLKLAQSNLYRLGGRITSNFSGIQSVCSDACAQVYLNGTPNYSLGCDGSRKFSGVEEGEMVMGIPIEIIPEITFSLKIVTGAAGSS
ncbi:DUF169 domain-containing protein [Methanospirillum sp.]|uniref:DUF169 domain-containing protein n=1 Tax=Methanospirillum sp. TaxID=45200 RepID=UPI002986A84E|nr:DUF169 domain-containing protein [Methanospirillum sp.]